MPFTPSYTRPLILLFAACCLWATGPLFSQTSDMYKVLQERDKVFGGPRSDKALDLIQTLTGEYVLVGETRNQSEGGRDILLLKVGEDFSEQFTRSFGGFSNDGASSVVQAHDGGYVLAGYGMPGRSNGWGGTDAMLLKTDETGVPLWSNYFGSEADDVFRDIIQLDDGRFVATGTKNNRCWVACIDYKGEKIVWEFEVSGAETSSGMSLARTRDRRIVVTGFVDKPQLPTQAAVLLLQLDESGNLLSQKEIQSGDAARGMQIMELEDGALAIAGIAFSDNYRDDMCLIVINPDGSLRFEPRPYGGTGNDRAYALVQEWSGNLMLGGATMSHVEKAKRPNLWLRKINPENGESQWRKKAKEDLGYLQSDVCNALLINHQGYLLSAGFSNRPGKGDDAWLIQFNNEPLIQPVTPGRLKVENARLYEREQNKEVNPEERCYLGFYLSNAGQEHLRGLTAEIRQLTGDTGIAYPALVRLPAVPPAGKTFATVPLLGSATLTAGDHLFEVVFYDGVRTELERFTLNVRSNTSPKPDIRVSGAEFMVEKDHIVQRGEQVQFQFQLENAGNLTAGNVQLNLAVSGNIPFQQSLSVAADILPYSKKKVTVSFTIPEHYHSDTVTIYFSAADEQLKYATAGEYTLLLDEPLFILPDSLNKRGTLAVFWQQDFQDQAGAMMYEKQITAKAIIVSDRPVGIDQLVFIRNETDILPLLRAARLVLLQSENGIYLYKLHLPLALQLGVNVFQIRYLHESGRLASSLLSFRFEAPKPRLFLYSIGVPLQQEGLQYNIQNAADFHNFVFQNKNREYYRSIDARLISDPLQTEYYKIRRLLFEIRDRAKQGQYQPQDVLLIYISAQATDKIKGTFKIKASDYDGVEVETSAVDFEDFFLYFLDDPAVNCHKLLILDVFGVKKADKLPDSDHENEGVEISTLGATFTGMQNKHKNLLSLMACSPGESSYEDARWANSALMEAMTSLTQPENLKTCDTNIDHEISLLEFYNYLRQKTPGYTTSADYPPQTPFLVKGNGKLKDFTLFYY